MYKIKVYRLNENQHINDFLVIILKIIHKNYRDVFNEHWKINLGVQAGYGETTCYIEEEVCKSSLCLEIKGIEIYKALVLSKEYFFNVSILIESQKIEFGIFDSHYVYLSTPNLFLINTIKREIFHYKKAKIEICCF